MTMFATSVPALATTFTTTQILSSFKLPAYQSVVNTSNVQKAYDGGDWSLYISSLSNASSVDTYLAWSAAESRMSDYETVGTGKHYISCKSSAGADYVYHARFMNSSSTSKTGYLTGKWSPDDVSF